MYFVTSTGISIYMPASPSLHCYMYGLLFLPHAHRALGGTKVEPQLGSDACDWGLVLASDGQGRCTVVVIRTTSSRGQFRTDSR